MSSTFSVTIPPKYCEKLAQLKSKGQVTDLSGRVMSTSTIIAHITMDFLDGLDQEE